MACKFNVIGISDSRNQEFTRHVHDIIITGNVFSGGKRHREIMHEYLPKDYEWIDITVPLDKVFEQYDKCDEITIFASGDPLFNGFANTLKRRIPNAEINVYPYFNSLQMIAHRFLLPYASMHVVTLTGRGWKLFDAALIRNEKMIGILTDRHNTPVEIARRMIDYGYTNYRMYLGEMMGNEQMERCRILSLEEAAMLDDFVHPNALILEQTESRPHHLGIPEGDFELLDGRAAMITKMPIRLLTLSVLELERLTSLWDIGFCTGSVSIEARLLFPELDITSFEVREEGAHLMNTNARRFGALGITTVIDDFMTTDIMQYPAPDAVFIGGHNGRLIDMIQRISEVLIDGGVIVFNSVSSKSHDLFIEGVARTGMKMIGATRITVDNHNTITILKAQK